MPQANPGAPVATLYQNVYREPNRLRRAELSLCLRRNRANPLLRVRLFRQQKRMRFSQILARIDADTAPDQINVIANADIFFDDTIRRTTEIEADEFWALSRWDGEDPATAVRSTQYANVSQDAWIFRGHPRAMNADFPLGLLASDNRLAFEAHSAGYKVSNPSMTVRAYHVHASGIRNYDPNKPSSLVAGGRYWVPPTSLAE